MVRVCRDQGDRSADETRWLGRLASYLRGSSPFSFGRFQCSLPLLQPNETLFEAVVRRYCRPAHLLSRPVVASRHLHVGRLGEQLELPALDAWPGRIPRRGTRDGYQRRHGLRSEEHTSELQSQSNLVCRLLLEKKKKTR